MVYFDCNVERENRLIIDGSKQERLLEYVNQGIDIEVADIDCENALGGTNKDVKQKQKDVKSQRQKTGDVATGEFKGPWAGRFIIN